MTFLNAVLLGGLAAASVPLLIHLILRNRHRVVRWGAMHLLRGAIHQRARRLRWEQILLLLVRCAIPALLALCLARPVLKGAAALLGDAKTSVVIVLDNSYSMGSGGDQNGTFVQARQAALTILEGLGRGSDAAVVLMAGGGDPYLSEPSTDLARLKRLTGELRTGHGTAQVAESLETAAGLLARMQHPFREMVVIGDFQRVSWSEETAAARDRVRELLDPMPFRPQVTYFQVGAEDRDNVSVESLEFSRQVFGVGQPVQVRANLRNHGERDYRDLRVYFRVDGAERNATQLLLAAGEQRQVLFNHRFDQPGSHVVEVMADADSLEADNVFRASVPVWGQVSVVVVNGDPRPEPLEGETDFLEIALEPYRLAREDITDLLRARTVDGADWEPARLPEQKVAVLANLREVPRSGIKALQEFVRLGGGLLIFPGDRMDVSFYNRQLGGNAGLLPLEWRELAGEPAGGAAVARVSAEHFAHPALEYFNDPEHGSLADAEIRGWYRLTEKPQDPAVTVMARLDNGDPFLVERLYGEGRVIQCAVPCDAAWSNLPVRPVYLPLMQRLTVYLASTLFPPRNVEVGKPLVAFTSLDRAGGQAVVTDPRGRRREVPVTPGEARGIVEYADTREPGLYQMTLPEGELIHFVVKTQPAESELRRLPVEGLEAEAERLGGAAVQSLEAYRQLDNRRRFGRELWRPLWWVLLAFLFLEVYLQQRFGGPVRKAAA